MANEKRLIYSNVFLEEADKAIFMGFHAEERKQNFLDMISAMLGNCPTVDAVEVVRCKDCKHYRESEHPERTGINFCYRLKDRTGERIGYNYSDDDFCSYGERKDNEYD